MSKFLENLVGGFFIGMMVTIALGVGLNSCNRTAKTNSNDIVSSSKQKCPNWTMSDGKGNTECVDLKFKVEIVNDND